MGIYSEINRIVKKAQAPGFVPTPLYYSSMMPKGIRKQAQKNWSPGGEIDSWQNLAQSKMLRGMARGARNAIPGFIDGTIGTGAGLINGTGQFLGGGSFYDGWKESNDFVKKYYSDPIRKAEMFIVGNAVKKVLDGADSYYRGNIEKEIGQTHDANGAPTKKYKDYLEGLNMLDSVSDTVSSGTELALTWPMWGKAMGYGAKALGSVGSRVAPLIKANPKTFGRIAGKIGTIPMFLAEPIIENNASAKRIEEKKRLLENLPRKESVGASKPYLTDRLRALKELADAPGPYTAEEREKRNNLYLSELENTNSGISQSL